MSAPFTVDVKDTFSKYISNPAKQANMGWTVTNFWYIAIFFIGIILLAIPHVLLIVDADYRNNNKDKTPLVITMWIGFGFTLLGLFLVINNFYGVVARINSNVRQFPNDSLFMPESAESAAEIIRSAAKQDIEVTDLINRERYEAVRSTLGSSSSVKSSRPTIKSSAAIRRDQTGVSSQSPGSLNQQQQQFLQQQQQQQFLQQQRQLPQQQQQQLASATLSSKGGIFSSISDEGKQG